MVVHNVDNDDSMEEDVPVNIEILDQDFRLMFLILANSRVKVKW